MGGWEVMTVGDLFCIYIIVFFFKQKTAYEIKECDWSSDVCSSDLRKSDPKILEPIMRVSVETPNEFQGSIFASINQRRGVIISSVEDGLSSGIEAEVPLSEMFGYSTVLRSLTQGKAEFSMEFVKYGKVPKSIAEELIAEYEHPTTKSKI